MSGAGCKPAPDAWPPGGRSPAGHASPPRHNPLPQTPGDFGAALLPRRAAPAFNVPPMDATWSATGEGERWWFVGTLAIVRVPGEAVGDRFALLEFLFPRGASPGRDRRGPDGRGAHIPGRERRGPRARALDPGRPRADGPGRVGAGDRVDAPTRGHATAVARGARARFHRPPSGQRRPAAGTGRLIFPRSSSSSSSVRCERSRLTRPAAATAHRIATQVAVARP